MNLTIVVFLSVVCFVYGADQSRLIQNYYFGMYLYEQSGVVKTTKNSSMFQRWVISDFDKFWSHTGCATISTEGTRKFLGVNSQGFVYASDGHGRLSQEWKLLYPYIVNCGSGRALGCYAGGLVNTHIIKLDDISQVWRFFK